MSRHTIFATSQGREVHAAFDEGYEAFYLNNPACAYRLNSHYNREWHRGFNSAFFRNGGIDVQSIPEQRLRKVR